MEARRNPITGDPVLFAPERAQRPRAFGGEDTRRCPFCPGHEDDTPPEIERVGDPWRIRVFPNRYPPAPGAEVVVESADHSQTFDALLRPHDVVETCVRRYRAHGESPYTAIFKNEGPRAGSSIPHVHSQIVPLPFVPPRVEREGRAFSEAHACPLCQPAGIVIAATESFLWQAPDASAMPYQQWITPRRHLPEVSDLSAEELRDLAGLLQRAARATLEIGESYNWTFLNFPRTGAGHFYVELYPRLTTIAGLELGTGTFVEVIDPAAAAARLRD